MLLCEAAVSLQSTKRLTSVTHWWLKPELQTHGCKIRLDSSPFLHTRFSHMLYLEWTYIVHGTKSPQYVSWGGFFSCIWLLELHLLFMLKNGPSQKGRKTLLSKWRSEVHRTWCQHVTLTRKSLDPIGSHLLLLWLFSSACPWVGNCVSLRGCKWSLCLIKVEK